MNHVNSIPHKGISIIYSDLSNLDNDSAKIAMQSAMNIITKMPLKSVYSLVNLQGIEYTRELMAEIKATGTTNTPYVKATAICGLNPMASFLANSVIKMTKRNAKLFRNPDEGKAWLYQESVKSRMEEQLTNSKIA